MYSDQDIASVFEFLNNTPEGSLRKMLVGGDLTDVHFRLLLKIAKNGSQADFVTNFKADSLPRLRMSPAESKMKDTFWGVCKSKIQSLGLLSLGGSSGQKAA